jgi:hypothetical protein
MTASSAMSPSASDRQAAQAEDRLEVLLPSGRAAASCRRRAECIALRSGQFLEVAQQRRAQLLQASEGELHLRLDPGRPEHLAPGGESHEVLEQRGCADTGFAPEHPGRAAALWDGGQ